MKSIPAHKQTNPDKLPGQVVNPVEQSLSNYIQRKYRLDAFEEVKKEQKLPFHKWYPLNKNKIGFSYDEAQLVWNAAQENK